MVTVTLPFWEYTLFSDIPWDSQIVQLSDLVPKNLEPQPKQNHGLQPDAGPQLGNPWSLTVPWGSLEPRHLCGVWAAHSFRGTIWIHIWTICLVIFSPGCPKPSSLFGPMTWPKNSPQQKGPSWSSWIFRRSASLSVISKATGTTRRDISQELKVYIYI